MHWQEYRRHDRSAPEHPDVRKPLIAGAGAAGARALSPERLGRPSGATTGRFIANSLAFEHYLAQRGLGEACDPPPVGGTALARPRRQLPAFRGMCVASSEIVVGGSRTVRALHLSQGADASVHAIAV